VNPLCGDIFNVYVRVEDERVVEASFQCECCGISMASASVMTEAITGRTVSEAKSLYRHFERLLTEPAATEDQPGDYGQLAVLGLIREFPSRVNCALLGWKTLDAALDGRSEVTIG
jgi:nitrogen fixation NifU-like protein